MYLVTNKCVTAVKVSNFSGHYLCNRSTLDIRVLGYIGILYYKEHPPNVWHIPPGTPCIGMKLGLSVWGKTRLKVFMNEVFSMIFEPNKDCGRQGK
jgi:hypothetical protein